MHLIENTFCRPGPEGRLMRISFSSSLETTFSSYKEPILLSKGPTHFLEAIGDDCFILKFLLKQVLLYNGRPAARDPGAPAGLPSLG